VKSALRHISDVLAYDGADGARTRITKIKLYSNSATANMVMIRIAIEEICPDMELELWELSSDLVLAEAGVSLQIIENDLVSVVY
jgi:hypothetical protein